MTKVSVVIPVYNVEKYLRECLDSIVNQTLKDIEIICVNDGSTDNSLEILKEYAQKDSRIIVIDKVNEGAATARNIGIDRAQGEYLAILDSDDIYNTSMLEKMLSNSISTEADITICRSQKLDNKTLEIIPTPHTIKAEYLPSKKVFCYKDIIDHVFDFCIGWSWDKLYKTRFIKETGLKFQNLRSTNDAYFVFVSLILANKISCIDDVLISHRMNTSTQLSETREKDSTCFIKAIHFIKDDLIERGLYEEVEQSFLNWVVDFAIWHISTLKNKKQQKELAKIVKEELILGLNMHKKGKEFFYNYSKYKKLNEASSFKALIRNISKNIFSINNSQNKKHKIINLLGLKLKIKRNKNDIYIIKNGKKKKVKKIKGLKIQFNGTHNKVYINMPLKFNNCEMVLGNNNVINLSKSKFCGYQNVNFLVTSNNCTIEVDENIAFMGGMLSLRNKPNTSIKIGKNCMFSSDIEIRTSDGHAIYDINTKELCNPDQDIIIGEHVWIGHGVSVLKGCTIASNTIIGTHSVVTKDCVSENSIYAGIPAKKIKENVMWDHCSPEKYVPKGENNA